jgi:hypothetical protein
MNRRVLLLLFVLVCACRSELPASSGIDETIAGWRRTLLADLAAPPVTSSFHLVHQPTIIPTCLHRDRRMRRESCQKLAEELTIMSKAQRLARLSFFVDCDERKTSCEHRIR